MLFSGIFFTALAQETNCADGVDNDGDGFIDCFDGDCANNPSCDESYIGKDKLCQDPPDGTLLFGMQLGSASADRTSLSYGRMVVGDLDRDGVPEMVTTHHNDKKIFILDGADLSTKLTINTTGVPEYFDHAIANLDDDDCGEIFIVEVISKKFYVTAYDCQGTKLWSTQAYDRPFTIGLADFDHDGQVELYYKNEILDAKTGVKLVNGSGNWNELDSGPVAVDILDDSECSECQGLELVLGGRIYAVDLTPRTAGGGSVGSPIKDFNNLPGLGSTVYHPKYVSFGYVNSMTSVADYNLDGHLDVVMSGATSKSATSTTTVFFWDVHNNDFAMYQPKQPDNKSWPHGTGRINLADVDGDGKMNATFVSGASIYSLKEDFTLLWQKNIIEQTSGFTSTTVFDFNNDNAVEIVYRDEANLYIIDGTTGNAFTTVPCRSRTANDYPIVVDVDGDGATEICVSCATDDNVDINNNDNTPYGQIRTYKSSLEPWVSARRVWNQYAYFNVNVNDDLTIPQVQQKHHLIFSQDVCGTGENRALNSFLNQSAILDSKGCKTYPAADITFVPNPELLNIVPPTCPDQDFLVSFSLENIGDLSVTGDIPITFYNGNPSVAGAVKLGTQIISLTNLRIGDQLDIQDMVVTGTGGAFTLFAVLNDNGSTAPPITLPNSGFDECNFLNNIVSASVVPRAFPLSTSMTDHIQCGVDPSPPNGSVKAYKLEGATEQTVGYTFHWFDGPTAGPAASADHVGSQVTGLADGTYSVYAVHDAFQCSSDTVQVAVGQQPLSISATINVDHPYTNCNDPDGQLSVTPGSGSVNDYTYVWFEGTNFETSPVLSDSSVLRFTRALTYSVLVTQISSQCQVLQSEVVPDLTVTPVVTTAFVPAACAPLNSGQASADVEGATSGYTFYWYDGSTTKPTEDFTGHTYANISAGNYTVVAKNNTTGCTSGEEVVSIASVDGITVSATVTAQQTSCAAANGSASANVEGTTTGYTFRWFDGDNTVTEIGTGATITGLAAGSYTVEATNTATGCTDTELITITDIIENPSVVASLMSNQTACLPPSGAVTASASGSPGPHIFYWFDGNVGTPDTTAADFIGATYNGVIAGFYTVVAVDANSRCESGRALVEVTDQTTDPVVTTSTEPQTGCDPAHPNGSASAEVGGITTGYKFRWFAGTDTTTFIVQNATLSDRAAGTYTVKAIDLATGCFTTQLVVIDDIRAQPTLSLVKQDNSVCSSGIGFTGSVTASLLTSPNSSAGDVYTYEWRKDGVLVPDETSETITGIDGGTYTVSVRNETLGCASDPIDITVNDVVDLPAITTTLTGSTNCLPELANGSAAVVTVDGTAVGGTSDYTYQWHIGPGTVTPIDVAANPSAATAVLTGVQGGASANFTVLVTNTLTGCAATAVVNIPDQKALPELSLLAADNAVCDPALTSPSTEFNGSITTTVSNQVGSLADYTFVLTGGTGVQDASPNHNRFLELDGGIVYTVTATHEITGCVSTPANVQVANNQDIPDLVTGNDGSTNCETGLEDGVARVVTIDGNPATTTGFTFAWTGALFDVSGNATNSAIELTGVQGGVGQNYSVVVTNLSNGCQNTAVVNVADEKEIPSLLLTTTPNSICDPALAVLGGGDYDGEVSADINTTGNYAGSVAADFDFTWNTGLSGVGENVLQHLDAGTYSVTAIHTGTGCESSPHTAQVASARQVPVIATSATPSQNCVGGSPDGIAAVTNVTPAGQHYDYRWFDATGAAGPTFLNTTSTTSSYDNIQGGVNGASTFEYSVEVTVLQTGCVNVAAIAVADASEVPVVGPLAGTDNTLCTIDKDGTATITTLSYRGSAVAAADFGDFDFVWSGGVQGPAETITALAAGSYTLTVRNTDDNCTSNPVSVAIDDDLFMPAIDVVSVDQTSCDVSAPNGSLTATIDESAISGSTGVTAGYTFSWTDDVTSGTTASNAIANLKGNQLYTISVVRDATQCASTQTVYLVERIVIPSVAVTPVDATTCAPANGALQATVLSGHTYFWYNDNDAPDGDYVIANFDDNTSGANYQNLVPGSYTLVVRDDATSCSSQPVISAIGDATPGMFPVAVNTLIPSTCTEFDGILNGGVHLTVTPNDFTTNPATDEITTAIPLGLGVNEPVVVSQTTGTLPLPLIANKAYYISSISGNTITLSETPGGPVVDITSIGTGSVGDVATTGHTFEWYAGIPSPTDPGLGSIDYFHNPPVYTDLPLATTELLEDVASGLYTLEVTNTATGCKAYLPHSLPYIGSHAVLRITKTNSTICPYTVGNGSIEIQIEDPPSVPPAINQTNYEVSLLQGVNVITSPFVPTVPEDPFVISNILAPGSYTVHVRETYSGAVPGCVIAQDVIIDADAQAPVLALTGPITPNTACDVALADGQIDFEISKDPNDLTGAGITYDVVMSPNPHGVIMNGLALGGYSATDLGPGSYSFTLTASNGCVTTRNYAIDDQPMITQLTAADLTIASAEYCDPALEQSARVVVNQLKVIGGGAENLADYRFDWFTDAALSTNIYSGIGDPTATKGGEELSNIGAPVATVPVTNGAYWVVATKLTGTGGLGCASPAYNLNINSNKVTPQITLTPFGDSSCDPAVFEGGLQVDVVTSAGPGNGGTYAYTWTPTGSAGQPVNAAGNTGVANMFNNINDGSYELTALNETTGCATTLSAAVPKIAPPVFTLDAAASALNDCATFDGRIDNIQVFVDGATGNVADFDYVWFRADTQPASVVLDGRDGAVSVDTELTLATYPGISLDAYFIRAVRKAGGAGVGCESVPIRRDILDARVYPQVSFATVSTTACDVNFDGQITVTASTASGPGTGSNYDFVWTSDPDGLAGTDFRVTDALNTAGPFTTANTDLVGEGEYNIRVTNLTTHCFTDAEVSVTGQTVPMQIVSLTPTPVDVCAPLSVNGSGTVVAVEIGNAPGNTGDFTYTWANNPGMNTPFATDDPLLVQNGLDIGTYYVTARRNTVVSPAMPGVTGSGCITTPASFSVLDRRVTPTISFATLSSTACDDSFDGQITVTASTASGPGAGSNYNFVWTNDPDGLAGTAYTASDSPDNNTASPFSTLAGDLIGPGAYVVRVTNFDTQCFADGTVNVGHNTVPVEVLAAMSTPQQICAVPADGSVSVSLADVTVGNQPVAGDITFAWEDAGGNSLGAGTTVTDLLTGSYFVRATRTAGAAPASACVSAPFEVVVGDERAYPAVALTATGNTSCNDVYDAAITLSATTSGIGSASTYDISWTSNPGNAVVIGDAANVASPYTTTAADNIGPGSYQVIVTNVLTQCTGNGSVTVLQNNMPVQIFDVARIDQTDCAPANGSITINTANPAHVNITGPYTFVWEKDGIALAPVPDNVLGGVGAGVYTVTGTKVSGVSAGCVTAPFHVVLNDRTENPVVELQSIPNFACDPALANGQLSAVIFDGTTAVSSANYDLQWFAGKNVTTGMGLGTTDILSSRVQGDYTLLVVDNVSPNMGCSNFASRAVTFTPTSFNITVAATDQDLCEPLQNGSVMVTGITETLNSVSTPAGDLSLYDYRWSDEAGVHHPSTPAFTGGITGINNLLAGSYTVQVRNALGCISKETAGIVDDNTVLPVITLEDFTNPAICVLPEVQGYLFVSADHDPLNAGNFVFDWFEGPDDTGTSAGTGTPELSNILYSQPDEYTVRVTNPLTACVNHETYRFRTDTLGIKVLASAVGRTDCLVDNGSLFATTLTGSGGLYNYEWYAGSSVTGTPVYTTKEVTGVPMGEYTVIAVSPGHAFCESTPYTTRVTDARVAPSVVAVQRNPLTYCDPANPNGVAFASVDNQVVGYVFDWFEGSTSGTPIYTGPEVTKLNATTYVVRATNVLTHCDNTASIVIENRPVDVQEPTVVILSHLTNCVDPDGALQATVNGASAGYFMEWYNGNTVRSISDASGEFYRELDAGFYTTTATDLQSGCVSGPVVTEILPFQELPDFDIVTTPTHCEQNVGGAILVLNNDVQLYSVEWNIDNDIQFGTMLSGLPKGEFTVLATTYQQCSLEKTFIIRPEILVFNGVSRNNDGKHDYFEIACIQDFPQNNVKIFNRAGTLVYEANGYDNQDVLFDGISNRGINLLGTDLPDGTYFYIVDKRDGSEPKNGYLELLR